MIKIPYKVTEGEQRRKARRSYYFAQYMSVYQQDKFKTKGKPIQNPEENAKVKENE